MELIIGPRRFSTWSLRPWLVLKRCGAEFTVRELDFNTPEGHAEMLSVSPTGLVPVLKVDGETIWDSMAISVLCAERFPEAKLWPAEAKARWLARSAACEMHGGFGALRTHCTMNPNHPMVGPERSPTPQNDAVAADIRRLVTLFRGMRERFGAGGDYLFGEWSVPDAFFTPIATRIRHYQIDLAQYGDEDGVAATYVAALLQQPDFLEWEALA
ncbi:glutathione S-transferase [Brevundimonas goettingensis]|uniref:Glutathione S-transferase n=1 Tax=Brevundimonas goettingensis TaxID=2774190 RepID=A0A975C0R6_9CAUL|nr:glutathione S-transferase [Brevundimonas goettingensis]QTC91651.1 glutathione S-transferase [Brevundimonas goettingensis]